MKVVSSSELFEKLSPALNLPELLMSFSLTMKAGDIPKVTVEYGLMEEQARKFTQVMKEYRLTGEKDLEQEK